MTTRHAVRVHTCEARKRIPLKDARAVAHVLSTALQYCSFMRCTHACRVGGKPFEMGVVGSSARVRQGTPRPSEYRAHGAAAADVYMS